LCYVGLTRAKDRLFLSYAQNRSLYGAGSYNLPSRFLEELPSVLLEYRQGDVGSRAPRPAWASGRPGAPSSPPARSGPASTAVPGGAPGPRREREDVGLASGDHVVHAKFGKGVVLGVDPGGVVRVFFSELGEQKKLLLDYAPLKRV
jgi:DNA helicase-2/ATP-dependent DNA helicase PcrA